MEKHLYTDMHVFIVATDEAAARQMLRRWHYKPRRHGKQILVKIPDTEIININISAGDLAKIEKEGVIARARAESED